MGASFGQFRDCISISTPIALRLIQLEQSGAFALSVAGVSTTAMPYDVSASGMFSRLDAIVNVSANGGSKIVDVKRREPDAEFARGYEWEITYAPFGCDQSGVSIMVRVMWYS